MRLLVSVTSWQSLAQCSLLQKKQLIDRFGLTVDATKALVVPAGMLNFDLSLTLPFSEILTFSLTSRASILTRLMLILSSISHMSWEVFLAIFRVTSAGMRNIITGISKLPYCFEETPKLSRPLTCTRILSYSERRLFAFLFDEVCRFTNSCIWALITCYDFPTLAFSKSTAFS